MANSFLKAQWRKLLMVNYTLPSSVLLPYLPAHTELDLIDGQAIASMVGFMFTDVRIKGLRIPFHDHFEEVNLRFYVKHKTNDGWRRGVVFISEIVPKPAITFVANTLYGEHYETLKMRHSFNSRGNTQDIAYEWNRKGVWQKLSVSAERQTQEMAVGSEEEFITEHYFGYTKLKSGKTSEYGVEHPRWQVYPIIKFEASLDFELNYGKDFALMNGLSPRSVLLAEGSAIQVLGGRKL
jgi:uncharacterized protein YqjF (DUF2071 family)